MNGNPENSPFFPDRRRRLNGAALVLVLVFLVLITFLVIAFFSSVTSELSGANKYASGASAKQLADSAVQTVMGSIKLATSGTSPSGGTAAWASQPGMIRTYDDSGNRLNCYKLYSSENMIITSGTYDPAADVDANWLSKPALFTDLNSPISSGSSFSFPVVDGNGIKMLSKSAAGTATSPYLGYDANGDGLPDVEGFSIDPAKVNYNPNGTLSAANNPVPMPTKWIYVLKDGSLTAPTGVDPTGKIATWSGAPVAPTESNPITGRIAFWTDDETCKVNINTASAGSYWDIPRTNSADDHNYASSQPVDKEYQRYPGHPATTSLKPVFSTLWLNEASSQAANEQIYRVTPRITGGGSMGGSVATSGTAVATSPSIVPDRDRLYASADELLFTPLLSGSTRATQGLTKAQLEQGRFFITANSRAPDVNLFNKPRVCIWPVSGFSGSEYRTTFDNLFAFCSTSGSGHAYYFQRSDPDSPTADLADAGSSAPSGRNRMLLNYLHDLTSKPIPGFGGNFQNKYDTQNGKGGTDCDQVLTEIFDYIRCGNLYDQNLALVSGNSAKPFAPPTSSSDRTGVGQVVPIEDNVRGTRGFGRFPTIRNAFFMFIGSAQNPPRGSGTFDYNGNTLTPKQTTRVDPTLAEMNPYGINTNPQGVLNGRIRVQGAFFIDPFCVSYGHVNIWPKLTVKVEGLDQITFGPLNSGTSPANLPTGSGTSTVAGNIANQRIPIGPASASFTTPPSSPTPTFSVAKMSIMPGGNMGFMSFVLGKGVAGSGAYPFYASTTTSTGTSGGVVTATTSDLDAPGLGSSGSEVVPQFYFSGGVVTVTLYNKAGTTPVQTLKLNFPPGTFPVPQLAPTSPTEGTSDPNSYDKLGNFRYFVTGTSVIQTTPSRTSSGGRLSSAGDGGSGNWSPCAWIIDTDVARAMEVKSGDVRLIAARAEVEETMFAPHTAYAGPGRMAHSLRGTFNNPYYGASVGRLVNLPLFSAPLNKTSYNTVCTLSLTSLNSNYSNNAAAVDFGNPSVSGTGIYVGGASPASKVPGDWDNGQGYAPDGCYINKADEGDGAPGANQEPYFSMTLGEKIDAQATLFSPNRQFPSAAIFGSLPTGIFANNAWQTLLFRPLPIGHPGLGTSGSGSGDAGPPYSIPPDHLLLDLFTMPVVEPYPISEPLSTAGRINMNFQIAPFTYLNRDTGIRAVLEAEKVLAIADSQSATYKPGTTNPGTLRYPINIEETLTGFLARFNKNDLFRSPSEICGIHLVPKDPADPNAKYSSMEAYWKTHQLTGDNSRERNYTSIYPRLTTKSNTFTVYFRVQTLKKVRSTGVATWDEKRDVVTSEYRGSQTIERYVDASDSTIPDYADPSVYNSASTTVNPPIDKFYKFRIIASKQFTP